jgi:hypothetical protein
LESELKLLDRSTVRPHSIANCRQARVTPVCFRQSDDNILKSTSHIARSRGAPARHVPVVILRKEQLSLVSRTPFDMLESNNKREVMTTRL